MDHHLITFYFDHSEVRLCTKRSTQEQFAVKVMTRGPVDLSAMFYNEVGILASLSKIVRLQ